MTFFTTLVKALDERLKKSLSSSAEANGTVLVRNNMPRTKNANVLKMKDGCFCIALPPK